MARAAYERPKNPLQRKRLGTRTVYDGPQALAAVAEFKPHMVFLDIGLPGMSGYEVATQLRSDPALRSVVLAALTGWGSTDDRRRRGRGLRELTPDASAIAKLWRKRARWDPSPEFVPSLPKPLFL